jgi:hypothetical protein
MRRAHGLIALGTALLGAAAVFACASETIVLVDIPETETGAPAPVPTPCSIPSQCDPGEYCQKDTCTAALGTCQPLPAGCAADEEKWVCGCDHVTYFNDCLRKSNVVVSSVPGACSFPNITECDDFAHPCALRGDGGQGEYCAHPVQWCPHDLHDLHVHGQCWYLPATCPDSGSTPTVPRCAYGQTGAHCVDTDMCAAIRGEAPYLIDPQQCP